MTSGRHLLTVSAFVWLSVGTSNAVELGSLLDGASLTNGHLELSNWNIAYLNHTVEVVPDVRSIEVQAVTEAKNVGFGVLTDSLATLDADILELELSFDVTATMGGMRGISVSLGTYEALGETGTISISAEAFSKSDEELGFVEVVVDSSGPFGAPTDSIGFNYAPSISVFQSIVIDGDQLGSAHSLIEYTQLFTISADVDINSDGAVTVEDVDELVLRIVSDEHPQEFDLNFDGLVNRDDLQVWLVDAGFAIGFGHPILAGDANLDGSVDAEDLNTIGINWQRSARGWSSGDFVPSGFIDAEDLNVLGVNWQTISHAQALAVPEPCNQVWGIALFCGCCWSLWRTRA